MLRFRSSGMLILQGFEMAKMALAIFCIYIAQTQLLLRGNHLMLTSEHTAREIEQKARKVMGMLKRGIKFTPTQPDVMAILVKLRERR